MHPKATGFGCIFSVNNIDRYFLSGALRIGADDCTDLFGDAALTADHLAHIVGRNVQLQRQLVLPCFSVTVTSSGCSTRFLAM